MDDAQIQNAPTAVDNVARMCVTSVDDSHTAEDVEDTCPLTALKRIRTCVRYISFFTSTAMNVQMYKVCYNSSL